MFCPKCGKEYTDASAKFCSSCGQNFCAAVSNTPNSAPLMQNELLQIEVKKKSLAVAGLFNVLIPGAGYYYVQKPVWGTIFVIATILAFIYSPASVTALYIISIIGSVFYGYKYNKELLQNAIEPKEKNLLD